MDWKEATGDDTLGLVRGGREKGEEGSESLSRRYEGIEFINYERL